MAFQEGDRGELLVDLAGLAVDLDEALKLGEFVEGGHAGLGEVEDVGELAVGFDLGLDAGVGDEGGHDDEDGEGRLNSGRNTLQIGQLLFLLITRIL